MTRITAVLLDSGGVLNRPATGHWFISPHFFEFVDERKFCAVSTRRRRSAFARGSSYLAAHPLIPTIKDEYYHFVEFYRIVFAALSELKVSSDRVASVASDLVHCDDKYRFFEDAAEILPRLGRSHRLAVVSDAWPSLENVYRAARMREHFSSFVISSTINSWKPDPVIYKTALEELGVHPSDTLFVDDHPKNCDGARKLGLHTAVMCRDLRSALYQRAAGCRHRLVRNLVEVERMADTVFAR